uniref:Uncharacterized protein n=1 Tax=Ditylum brightwellii TaxID=49249 RepID=A0A6V2Q0K5_9STRA|mmetsp:Transcript_28911/g.38404  ORF Transcript_28911/g.38404 Transcript_28911/m.38404 type:complete len:295 (+) Transcript_28911:14-898(+)
MRSPSSSLAIPLLLVSLVVVLPLSSAMAATTARLAGQRVLVTGGGRGIGRAIALICYKEGAKVAVSSRTQSDLDETASLALGLSCAAATEGRTIDTYISDVTKEQDVESMVESIMERWGGIDVLVNNAGGGQATKGPLETLQTDDLRRLLELNVVGVHAVTSSVLRKAMLPAQSGRIVNISSRAGKVGLPNYSFYVASKFALEGMTASLAEELKDKNILVNTLSPGMVDTKSFPKPPGRKGVRSAESVEDGLFTILESGMTGHYLHVDELDEARGKGLDDSIAMKPIRENVFLS